MTMTEESHGWNEDACCSIACRLPIAWTCGLGYGNGLTWGRVF